MNVVAVGWFGLCLSVLICVNLSALVESSQQRIAVRSTVGLQRSHQHSQRVRICQPRSTQSRLQVSTTRSYICLRKIYAFLFQLLTKQVVGIEQVSAARIADANSPRRHQYVLAQTNKRANRQTE